MLLGHLPLQLGELFGDLDNLGVAGKLVELEVVLDVARLDAGVREEFVGFKDFFVTNHPCDAILRHLVLTEDFEHADFGVQFNLLVLPKPVDGLFSSHLGRLLQSKLSSHALDRLFELEVLLHVFRSSEVDCLSSVPDFAGDFNLLHQADKRADFDEIVEDFHLRVDFVVFLLHGFTLVIVDKFAAAFGDEALLLLVVPLVGDDVLLHKRRDLEQIIVGQGAVALDGRLAELFSFSEHLLLCFLWQFMVCGLLYLTVD